MKKILLSLLAGTFVFSTANAQTPIKENVTLFGKLTANWCPPCGGWGWQLNEDVLHDAGTKAMGLSMYADLSQSQNNGHFQNQAAYDMKNKITLTGWPAFSVNLNNISAQNSSGGGVNTAGIKADAADSISTFSSATVVASTGMVYKIDGNTVTIETKTKFWEDASGTYKIAVYLVEDGAMQTQAGKSGTVAHHNVLRASVTASTWGKTLSTGSITKGTEFDETFTFDLTSSTTPAYSDQPSTWDKTLLVPMAVIYKQNGSTHDYVNGTNHFEWPASVAGISYVNNVAMFPNPAQNYTAVSFDTDKPTSATINVVDMTGRTVYTSGLQNVKTGRYIHKINTSNLAAGLYNVTIATDNGFNTQKLNVVK